MRVRVVGDAADLARDMANDMLAAIVAAKSRGRPLTAIIPVGPVDQFPILADLINSQRIDCREVVFINMDEYLTDNDEWIDAEHPLSFSRYMNRKFNDLLDQDLSPRPECRVFPEPRDLGAIQKLFDKRGGVDVTYGGIGINGHIAFNEPEDGISASEFAQLRRASST